MSPAPARPLLIALGTALVLLAFAANSVLCRLALGEGDSQAVGFTSVRLASGAVVLALLARAAGGGARGAAASGARHWGGAALLFLYAIAFSYAYLALDTASGALILFGAVQLTLVAASLLAGKRLHGLEWLGLALALAGLTWLLLPGATRPAPLGFALMVAAGAAWGGYTLLGRSSRDPLTDTARNFLRTLPMVAVTLVIAGSPALRMEPRDWWLAGASGALASGLGYAAWYRVLPALSPIQAGVAQLLVPVIAALGGVLFVGERPGSRLLLAGGLILGGIALVSWARTRPSAGRH